MCSCGQPRAATPQQRQSQESASLGEDGVASDSNDMGMSSSLSNSDSELGGDSGGGIDSSSSPFSAFFVSSSVQALITPDIVDLRPGGGIGVLGSGISSVGASTQRTLPHAQWFCPR